LSIIVANQLWFLADVSTFNVANSQGGRSLAPELQRSQWNNPCSWLTFVTILLVVFLSVFRYEFVHLILEASIIGYGTRCLFYNTYRRSRWQSSRPPRVISIVSQGSEGGESQTSWRQRYVQLN